MDAYEQISPKRFRRVLIAMVFGLFLAIGLGILLFMVLVRDWQIYFDSIFDLAFTAGIDNVPLVYFLGSGLYSMNAASPFFVDMFFHPSAPAEFQLVGQGILSAALPAVLTWFITGFVMGFFCKRWDDGLFSALLCGIATFIVIQVMARVAILGSDVLGVLELGYIILVFMLLVNSAAAVFICMAGGVLGGLLYSKVLFRRQAMIEEYM